MSPRFEIRSPRFLSAPCNLSVIEILIRLSAQAQSTLSDLLLRPSAESLHGFRVAVRRLRAALKLFREVSIDRRGLRSLRAHLAKITKATNDVRDLQVMQEQLLELRRGVGGSSHASAVMEFSDQILGVLERKSDAALRRALMYVRREKKWLTKELGHDARMVFSGVAAHPIPFADLLHSIERRYTKKLKRTLQSFKSCKDRQSLHEIRLLSKNLRYLLEPFCSTSSRVKSKVQTLRDAQDLLGALRDSQRLRKFLLDSPEIQKISEKSFRRTRSQRPALKRRAKQHDASPQSPKGSAIQGTEALRVSPLDLLREALRQRSRAHAQQFERLWVRSAFPLRLTAFHGPAVLTEESSSKEASSSVGQPRSPERLHTGVMDLR